MEQRSLVRRGLLASLACAQAAGCAVTSGDETKMSTGTVMEAPHFEEVYAVLAQGCGGGMSGCHITGTAAGLAMPDATSGYASLVNVGSPKCDGALRVVPGDADASLLVGVLEGTASCVKAMPLGRDRLDDDALDLIRTWIDSGAEE